MIYSRKIILILMMAFLLVFSSACGGEKFEDTQPTSAESTTTVKSETTTTEPVTQQSETEEDTSAEETETTAMETEEEIAEEVPELVWSRKHDNKLESVAVSPDGHFVAVGEYLTVYIHLLADGELVDVLTYDHSAEDIEYSPDGTMMAAGLSAYGASLTDVESGQNRQLHGGYNARVAFSPNGGVVATGDRKGTVWIWRTEDCEQLAALEVSDPEMLTSLDFHPSGRLIAAALWTDEGTVYIWDVEEEQIVHTLELDNLFGSIENPFKFSLDGTIMAGAVRENFEHFVRLWTVDEAKQLADLPVPKNLKDMDFSPDGNMLAVASQKAVTIWDVSKRELRYTLDLTFDPEVSDWIVELAFTPDGGHVAVTRWDGTVELWRLPGAEPIVAPPMDIRTPPPLPGDVLFDTGSDKLKEEAYPELEEFAKELYSNFKKATITFIGHTDSRGSAEDNLQLSSKRAIAIRNWFDKWARENGADGWILETDGRGEDELKVPDIDAEGTFLEEAGALNRRVEIEIEVD